MKQPLDGSFARAKTYVDEYQQHFLRTQYGDGSWSCRPAAGQASDRDFASQFLYSGQAAEWLALSLPAAKLEEPALVKSVEFLDGVLNSERYRWNVQALSSRDIAAVAHAAHALVVYDTRVFKPADAPEPAPDQKRKGVQPVVTAAGGQAGGLGHAIERARRLREFARFWELSQAASPGRQPGDKAASSQGGGDLNTDAPGSRTHQFAPGDSR